MKNKTIFIAAMLAVATVLAAGLMVLPSSVQEAQANPCSNNANAEAEEDSTAEGGTVNSFPGDDQECELIGNFEDAFEE
jgi:hypothetical protein